MAKHNSTTEQSLDAARNLFDIHEDFAMRVTAFIRVARNEIAYLVESDTDNLSFLVAGLALLTAESSRNADQVSQNHGLHPGVQS